MSYGFKVFNWVEDAEKEFGGSRSFYEAKEVDDYIRVIKSENRRLQHKYNQAVLAANENIANKVDGNAQYWKELCEKRTKMYLEEQARANALGEQIQKEIHKPFPYIEKLKVMKIALLRQMSQTAYHHYKYIDLLAKCRYSSIKDKKKLKRKHRQWKLFSEKAEELEKELNEE